LLHEAGWKDEDGDGILERDGHKFVFEIVTNQGNETRGKCAEIIQKRLAEVGIKAKIRVLEWASLVNDFIGKRRFEATILGWTIPQDPDIFDVWHSSKTGPDELNFVSYRNREVDRLIEKDGQHSIGRNEKPTMIGSRKFSLRISPTCFSSCPTPYRSSMHVSTGLNLPPWGSVTILSAGTCPRTPKNTS